MGKVLTSKTLWVGALLALVLIASAVWFWWQREQSRWDLDLLAHLPAQADLYVVADLEALQSNAAVRGYLADPPEHSREQEYQRFVEATGFRYQDHLKRLALAKLGADWMGVARAELDAAKIEQYTEAQGGRKFQQQGRTVYEFGTTRPFRLTLLEQNLVLFTIGEDAGNIRQALQMYLKPSGSSGAAELQQGEDLRHIRQGSSLWAVGRMEKLRGGEDSGPRFGAFELSQSLLQGSKTLYVSAQSTPLQLQFQAENYCDSPETAERIASFLQALLKILRAPPSSAPQQGQANPAAFLSDLSVRQAGESVFIEWQWNEQVWRWLREQSK
ncbi:MAG: hypothetical protein A3H27_13190 [Acidobacteria bacterium RIFCSPLOWO2_02_FULL_59_13]|nr:MAG: hypothetical protein A3H27_13190 [Acidobacteria bacterium RIFCSPLOWO2_02_FULL_59_13]